MKIKRMCIIIILLALYNGVLLHLLQNEACIMSQYELLNITDEKVRNLYIDVSYNHINEAAANVDADVYEYITVLMALNDYSVSESDLNILSKSTFTKLRNRMVYYNAKEFYALKELYTSVLSDCDNEAYFPVPKSHKTDEWVTYTDSWGYDREYGGKRRHEGTDIMAKINSPGIYPIIAMCDGVIESMGWLELGGYRIGIRSSSGLYYYYAHLDSYASDICVGSNVKAGQFLGFMGNTGYSKVEGTKGKFAVHLHLGMYMDVDGSEISYNPYYILKNLSENVLYYSY